MQRSGKLLRSLRELRKLILEENLLTDKKGIVCTDQALVEIANKQPLKASDFLAISGLDKNFIEDYSSIFLKVIKEERLDTTKEVNVSKSALKVLNHYKDRLSNISKNNRNLYMGKIENIRSFDLYNLNENDVLLNFLTNEKIKKLDLNLDTLDFNNMTTLYRATNKDSKETGSYNLYIAYPYVEGIFRREKFPIKAPLLYFPVKINRSKRVFSLNKDFDKDIILNRDLLLLSSKIESGNLDNDMMVLNKFNKEVFVEVLKYYESQDIKSNNKEFSNEFLKFENELKDVFSKRKFNDFDLKPYITLGRYEPYSSMIQKDMSTILTNSKYNELLDGLIGEDNLYSEEALYKESATKSINEDRITYINDLNDAQEKVIDLLNEEKKLVIWGPPGTGKSQTITSLISSSVLKGENVLVVSEKKVALDVIYSRLKAASKYTMFVDDPENKNFFYTKLKNYIDPTPPVRTLNNDVYSLEQEILELTKTLDNSLKLLYGKHYDNNPIINIFDRFLKDREIKDNLTPLKVYETVNENFRNIKFKDLFKFEHTFDTKKKLKDYLYFNQILNDFPIILKLESKLTRSAKIELNNFDVYYQDFYNNYINSGYFKRRKLKKEFLVENKMKLNFLTKNNRLDKKYLNLILKDKRLNDFIVSDATKIDKYLTKHENLSKDEVKFLNMLTYDPLFKEIEEIEKYGKYIIDAYFTGYIENFKALNQENLYIIEDYIKNMDRINELMEEKRNVTVESFEMELYKKALNFSNTKRIMDIKRIIEAPSRPSIKAFIDMYQPELMENVKVWMMTPEVVSTIVPLLYGMFDLVIFDEASQMYVEKGIPAIYRAKKVVIAGDPKQLRPSSLGFGRVDNEDDLYEDDTFNNVQLDAKSLLDLARYKYKETLLNYHYRSKYEELIAFSNYAFYDAKLIVSPNQKNSKTPPIEYIYVEDGKFIDRKNEKEAREVIELIKLIFRRRKNNESIGVITFNSTQRDLIEKYIDQELFKKSTYQNKFDKELFRSEDGEDKSLFVKNIENVQGDERDIIIFSMGYAKDNYGKVNRRFGWLNHEGGENRLNVAITRAKKKIYFVSSLYPEELHVEDLTNSGPLLLKNFMRYCYHVSNKDQEQAKNVLNSLTETSDESSNKDALTLLVEDVKKRLERSGYLVETSIGIGSYKIDIAIYDKDSKEYLLAIICDINDFNDMNARTDLIHQEKYLKSRNWNVYRLFSSNWYIDPNKEMRNIRDTIKKGN